MDYLELLLKMMLILNRIDDEVFELLCELPLLLQMDIAGTIAGASADGGAIKMLGRGIEIDII